LAALTRVKRGHFVLSMRLPSQRRGPRPAIGREAIQGALHVGIGFAFSGSILALAEIRGHRPRVLRTSLSTAQETALRERLEQVVP
jgi:hypothetical protein